MNFKSFLLSIYRHRSHFINPIVMYRSVNLISHSDAAWPGLPPAVVVGCGGAMLRRRGCLPPPLSPLLAPHVPGGGMPDFVGSGTPFF